MKWLVETFGGFYTKHVPKVGRVWYQWNLNGAVAASSFLSFVLPYLGEKKHEAEILQEFYALGSQQNPSARQELMEKIRKAKHRGCVTTETLDRDVDDTVSHAYIAGTFDGEGCISPSVLSSGKSFMRIRMGNSYYPLVDLYLRTYGGWIHTRSETEKTREFYTWEITAREQKEKMLLSVMPYLRTKLEQAALALQYVRLPKTCGRELRHSLCQSVARLNNLKIQSELTGDRESAPAGMPPA
jgi:hypothetical protein